jgi:ribosomal protein L40E
VLFAALLRFKPASYFDVDDFESLEDIRDFQSNDQSLLNSTLTSTGYQVPKLSKEVAGIETEKLAIRHEQVINQSLCKTCNTSVEIDSRFCGECGYQLS